MAMKFQKRSVNGLSLPLRSDYGVDQANPRRPNSWEQQARADKRLYLNMQAHLCWIYESELDD